MLIALIIRDSQCLPKFPFVSKRPTVPGIIDFTKFSYDDLEEIVAGGQGSFEVYW